MFDDFYNNIAETKKNFFFHWQWHQQKNHLRVWSQSIEFEVDFRYQNNSSRAEISKFSILVSIFIKRVFSIFSFSTHITFSVRRNFSKRTEIGE